MPRAASLPGAGLFLKNMFFCLNKPLVPGSFAAWGRTFSRKSDFLEQATFRAASLPGAELLLRHQTVFLNKPLVWGSCAAWGRTVSQECVLFGKKPLVWGSCAAWRRTFSRILALLKHVTSTISTECTFTISGTPVRRTRRQKYQKLHHQ